MKNNGSGPLRSLVLALFFCNAALVGAQPLWWSEEETRILQDGGDEQNHAVANLGQLKHVALQAKVYLDANLVQGSGTTIGTLVAGFLSGTTPEEIESNYGTLNIGQLKAVAKPFYDRLLGAGYETRENLIAQGVSSTWEFDYPWDPGTPVAENYAPANTGQVKLVFSFDLSGFDADGDGIPNGYEQSQGFDPLDDNANGDPDGDGRANLTEYLIGSDPNSSDAETGPAFAATELSVFTPLE